MMAYFIILGIIYITYIYILIRYSYYYYKRDHQLFPEQEIILEPIIYEISDMRISIDYLSVLSYDIFSNTISFPRNLLNKPLNYREVFLIYHEIGHFIDLNKRNKFLIKIYILGLIINRLVVIPYLMVISFLDIFINKFYNLYIILPYFIFITILKVTLGSIYELKASSIAIEKIKDRFKSIDSSCLNFAYKIGLFNTLMQLFMAILISLTVILFVLLSIMN